MRAVSYKAGRAKSKITQVGKKLARKMPQFSVLDIILLNIFKRDAKQE